MRYLAFSTPEVIDDETAGQRHQSGAGYRVEFRESPIGRVVLTVYAEMSTGMEVRDDLGRTRWTFTWSQENWTQPDAPVGPNYLASAAGIFFKAGNDSADYDALFRITQREDGLCERLMSRYKPPEKHVVRSTGVPLVRLDPPRFGDYAEYLDFDYRGFMNIDRDIVEEFFPGGEIPPVCGLR